MKGNNLKIRIGLGVALISGLSVIGLLLTPEGSTASRSHAPIQQHVEKPYKVAVARFSHETCTFCPGGDPGIADWTYEGPPYAGNEVFRSSAYMRGFISEIQEFDDIEVVGLRSPRGVFGGTSRSWNQEEAFDHFVGLMLEDLKKALPVQGVYLDLHGAMAVRNIPRPEAEIAKRFREVVGPDVPIVASFDLHGNEDEEFLKWANASFATKRYPHYDSRLQGERAALYLRKMMRGSYKATSAVRKPPILTSTVVQWTGQSPMMNIMERARRLEDQNPGAVVNVFLGFPWSDVPDAGACVQVITNNDQELAEELADDIASYIWRYREKWSHGNYPLPEEAVSKTRAHIQQGETPIVLADYWDRPGDGTWTLAELIKQDVGNVLFGTITDQPNLEKIWKENLKVGDRFEAMVGGYTGPQAGKPVHIDGKLIWRGKHWGYDKVAAIAFGKGNVIILTPGYRQNTTPGSMKFGPINPDNFDVFVLKTRVHFRRGFDETGYAKHIYIVDAPGDWFGTTRLDHLNYQNLDIKQYYPFGNVEFK